MLQQIDLTKNKELAKQAKAIYLEAFPRTERMPWWILKLMARRKALMLAGYTDMGKLCGMTYHIETQNAVMVLYLAIDGNQRGHGYGSALLSCLRENYRDKAILLHIEPVDDPTAANAEERRRRLAFYQKNGFCDTGYDVTEIGGCFRVLSEGRKTDIVKEYKQAFRSLSFGLWNVKIEKSKESEQ